MIFEKVLKGAVLQASSLSLGVAGVSLGGVGASGYSFSRFSNVFASDNWIEDPLKVGPTISYDNASPQILANQKFSCYSRYLNNSSIDISTGIIEEPKTITKSEVLYDFKNKEYDEGCMFINFGENQQTWGEILLAKESKVKTILYFLHSTYVHVFRFDIDGDKAISKKHIKVHDSYGLEFHQQSQKTDSADLVLEKNGSNDIQLIITIDSPSASKIELKGTTWQNRNDYCKGMKNKTDYNEDEKEKVEKWCIARSK